MNNRCLPCSLVRGLVHSEPADEIEALAGRAEKFGGFKWGDAVRDSWLALANATALRNRMIQRGFPHDPAGQQLVCEHIGATFDWYRALLIVSFIIKNPEQANAVVAEAARVRLLDAGRTAYRSLRQLELMEEAAQWEGDVLLKKI